MPLPTKTLEQSSAFVSQMSQEIVHVDPTDVFLDMDPILPEDWQIFTRSITFQEQYVWEPYDSEKLPETLASEIQRFLRVANLVESEEPRIAYLCEFNYSCLPSSLIVTIFEFFSFEISSFLLIKE